MKRKNNNKDSPDWWEKACKDLSNKDLGKLIINATVYLECYMTEAKIQTLIAEENSKKAFFYEYK